MNPHSPESIDDREMQSFSLDLDIYTLRQILPKIDVEQLNTLMEKIVCNEPLKRADRLTIALVCLALDYPRPRNGSEAFQQIAQSFLSTEKTYLHDTVVRQWQQETGTDQGRAALVEEAFKAYRFDQPKTDYDENAHPSTFSAILKPPALRYNRDNVFDGKDVITQLNHITIIDRDSGAVEIQDIDPTLRSRLQKPTDPLVLAILDDHTYFQQLPQKSDLVIYRKLGQEGREMWVHGT